MAKKQQFQVIQVDSLEFMFPDDWCVIKYDDCAFYQQKHNKGIKAVDLLALNSDRTHLFMIEAKDFRQKQAKGLPLNNAEILEEVAQKIKNTLGFLMCAYLSQNKELDIFYNFLVDTAPPVLSIIFHMERDISITKEMRLGLVTRLTSNLDCLAHQRINVYDAHLLDEAFEHERDKKNWWHVNI